MLKIDNLNIDQFQRFLKGKTNESHYVMLVGALYNIKYLTDLLNDMQKDFDDKDSNDLYGNIKLESGIFMARSTLGLMIVNFLTNKDWLKSFNDTYINKVVLMLEFELETLKQWCLEMKDDKYEID